ncbi:hypothetical protein [Dongia deserti]|uniref:hypothetical protein n=1 Tax=Dongia deserti TaxID=2268030 RepID=UPI000E652CE2|nr:hypothetical protein [Dongia deserti]
MRRYVVLFPHAEPPQPARLHVDLDAAKDDIRAHCAGTEMADLDVQLRRVTGLRAEAIRCGHSGEVAYIAPVVEADRPSPGRGTMLVVDEEPFGLE